MNFYEAFSMAMKNIRSSKTRSILTMLGIIICRYSNYRSRKRNGKVYERTV